MDQFHIFSNEWRKHVTGKFDDEEKKGMISGIKDLLSQLFCYVETEDEIKLLFEAIEKYYNTIKEDLKSEDGCNAIEKIILSLDQNTKSISSHAFLNVTCFDFRGDSIAESSYSIAKCGSQAIKSNSALNTCGVKLTRISQNRGREKDK